MINSLFIAYKNVKMLKHTLKMVKTITKTFSVYVQFAPKDLVVIKIINLMTFMAIYKKDMEAKIQMKCKI